MENLIEFGIKAICRPPRAVYPIDQIPNTIFINGYGTVHRKAVSFPNTRGLKIVGSLYSPNEMPNDPSCIIYLHGNASSQIEGIFLIPFFVPAGVSILCFDFSGCGNSEGDFISLGLLESDDVESAIAYLRAKHSINKFALYGRSMGAATCFFSMAENPKIICSVADSPFASLPQLISEIIRNNGIFGFLSPGLIWYLGKKIRERKNFDIKECVPIEYASKCKAPVFIIHGEDDTFINCEHSKMLLNAYGGQNKVIRITPGNHNSERPIEIINDAVMFLANALGVDVSFSPEQFSQRLQSAYHHFENVEDMMSSIEY